MGEMIWPNLGGESEPDDRRTQIGSYYRLVKNMFLLLVSTLKFVNTGLATPSCDLLFLVCESSDSQYSLCILDARIRRLLVSEQSILPSHTYNAWPSWSSAVNILQPLITHRSVLF
jgi:hypothetical protein